MLSRTLITMASERLAAELVTLGLLQFLSGVVGTIAQVGSAALFSIGWSIVALAGVGTGSVLETGVYVSLQLMTMAPLRAFLGRKCCNLRFVGIVAPLWAGFEFLGTNLMAASATDHWVSQALGMMLLLIFLFEIARVIAPVVMRKVGCVRERPFSEVASERTDIEYFAMVKPKNVLKACVLGITGGFLSGLFNVALFATLTFALYSGMKKDEWRNTMACVTLVTVPAKLLQLYFVVQVWDDDRWPHYATCVAMTLAAMPIDNMLAARVNEKLFRKLILCFVLFGSVVLMSTSAGPVTKVAVDCVAAVCSIVLFSMWVMIECKSDTGSQLGKTFSGSDCDVVEIAIEVFEVKSESVAYLAEGERSTNARNEVAEAPISL